MTATTGIADLLQSVTEKVPAMYLPQNFVLWKIRKAGQEWNYLVYVSPICANDTPLPTIVFLGGSGECGSDPHRLLQSGLAPALMSHPEKWPFIIIFPQKPVPYGEREWIAEDDMVMSIIEHARQEYSIDMSRLYLTGMSEGGRGTYEIAAKHFDLFAAIVPIAGGPRKTGNPKEIAERLRDTPIWMFHSVRDDAIPVSVAYRMETLLHSLGAVGVKLTTYDKDGLMHGGWNEAYLDSDLPEWLLQHDTLTTRKQHTADVADIGPDVDMQEAWDRVVESFRRSAFTRRTIHSVSSDIGLVPAVVRQAIGAHKKEIVKCRKLSEDGCELYRMAP